MKLKDFLKQFQGLDPETEVCKWSYDTPDHIVELLTESDTIDIRYVENIDKQFYRYYDHIQRDVYTKKVVVIP